MNSGRNRTRPAPNRPSTRFAHGTHRFTYPQGGNRTTTCPVRPAWRWAIVSAALAALSLFLPWHAVRDVTGGLVLITVIFAAWEPDVALIGLFAFLPFRTLLEAAAPLPLKFVADAAVIALVLRVVLLHPQSIFPLDAIEGFGLAFIGYGLIATAHAHAHLLPALLEARDLLLFWLAYAAVRRLAREHDGPSADLWGRAMPFALGAIAIIGAEGLLGLMLVHHYGPHPAPFLVPGHWLSEPITPVNRGRPYGWVNNPNVFGELGAIGFFLAASQWGHRRTLRQGAPYLALACLFVLMTVFSFSRSAWIAFALFVVVELSGVRSVRQAMVPVVGAVLALGLILVVPHASHRAAQATAQPTLTASRRFGRIHTLREAELLARRRPLGTGLGTFGSGASQVFHQTVRGIPHTFYGDDNYAVLLVEAGVPGLILFLLTGLAVYRLLLRSSRSRDGRRTTFGLFLAVTALGAVGNSWEQLNLSVYPWLALAILIGAGGYVAFDHDPSAKAPSTT